MSAFAALKALRSSASPLEPTATPQPDDFSENDIQDDESIQYQHNSSDEQNSDEQNSDEENNNDEGEVVANHRAFATSTTTTTTTSYSVPPVSHIGSSRGFHFSSNFVPNNKNIIFTQDHVLIGLQRGQFILVNGQCKLTVDTGAALINDLHYLSSTSSHASHNIISTSAHSLPVISSIPYSNTKNKSLSPSVHFDNTTYETVLKLENLHTGLEKIGTFYSPFKSLVHNRESQDTNAYDEYFDSDLDRYTTIFKNYSFEIVLNNNRTLSGINVDPSWKAAVTEAINKCSQNPGDPKIFMVIGTKNSGKSTMSKMLFNNLIKYVNKRRRKNDGAIDNRKQVSYLDLDPGQSEYSNPYTLSISTHTEPSFGLNIPQRRYCDENYQSHYYGFTSPQDMPNQYVSIIKSLLSHYNQHHRANGTHLVVNTPGWVKGFGKELLVELTQLIQPDQLLFLSNSLEENAPDNFEVLEDLYYNDVSILPGIYKASKYTPTQLRLFNKLVYFHQSATLSFNFDTPFLSTPPLKLSYQSLNGSATTGVSAVSVFNQDVSLNFDMNDLVLMLEASIVGIYAVPASSFTQFDARLVNNKKCGNLPLYLNSSDYSALIDYDTPGLRFLGLSMIHSINLSGHYFNLYLPFGDEIKSVINHHLLENGDKIILVKGEGAIPICELVNPNTSTDYEKQGKALPYVSFDNRSKVGDVWRIRRNVSRNRRN